MNPQAYFDSLQELCCWDKLLIVIYESISHKDLSTIVIYKHIFSVEWYFI